MEKLKSTLPNMLLSLTVICALMAGILGGVFLLTKGPIAATEKKAKVEAIEKVCPAFDNDPTMESYKAAVAEGDSLVIYPAKKDGKLVGVAVESNTNKGFSGFISIMIGINLTGEQPILQNYSVLQHAETPGLGSKMQEWFSNAEKPGQYICNRPFTGDPFVVSKDGGNVDAITAATISSRAFLDAVNRAYAAYANQPSDASSSATAKASSSGNEHSEDSSNDSIQFTTTEQNQ